MSTFTLFTAALACLAPFVAAYTQPTGDSPVGNPITSPGLGTIVPVGQSYNVQWTPTTDGTVTLVLLKGPATNLQVVGPIAESIQNSGSYSWTPSTDLTPGSEAAKGYGIQLIVDATGQYQYTTQFGISNPYWQSGSWTAAWPSATSWTTSWTTDSAALSAYTSWASDSAWSSTTAADATTTDSAWASSSAVWSNSSTVVPITTASLTTSVLSTTLSSASRTPSSPSSTTATAATSTGGAGNLKSGAMGLVAVAGIALLAL